MTTLRTITLIVAVLAIAATAAFAQTATTDTTTCAPAPGASVSAGAGAGPAMGSDMAGMMSMMGPSAMTVDNRFVYVVRGNEILKFDKSNLTLISRAAIPAMGTTAAGAGAGPAISTYPSGYGQGPALAPALVPLQSLTGPQFDQAFIQQSIVLNSEGVALARLGAEKATSAAVRNLAAKMVIAHQKEQQRFSADLQDRFGVMIQPQTPADFSTSLSSLQAMSGAEFDRAWLQQMIGVHQQISQSTQMAVDKASIRSLRREASKINKDSNSEIAQMQQMLQSSGT